MSHNLKTCQCKHCTRGRIYAPIESARRKREAERQRDDVIRVERAHTIGKAGRVYGWHKSVDLELNRKRGLTREDRAWRESVLSRDGNACVKCGATEHLEADHIKPVAIYPELRFNVENGQTLCHPCHVATPTYGAKVHKLTEVSVQ